MTYLTDQIDAMVRDGDDFAECERFIDKQVQLDEEQRAALWLYALLSLPEAKRVAQEIVAELS